MNGGYSSIAQRNDLLNFENSVDSVSVFLNNDFYTLELRTFILRDTLKKQWEKYGFEYPYITKQYLIFYKYNKQITQRLIPVKKVFKELRNDSKVSLSSIPVFDICLLKEDTVAFYSVYGANFCCGVNCLEFFGGYSMDGKILFEQTTPDNYLKIKDKDTFECSVSLPNNKDTCVSILNIFIPIGGW